MQSGSSLRLSAILIQLREDAAADTLLPSVGSDPAGGNQRPGLGSTPPPPRRRRRRVRLRSNITIWLVRLVFRWLRDASLWIIGVFLLGPWRRAAIQAWGITPEQLSAGGRTVNLTARTSRLTSAPGAERLRLLPGGLDHCRRRTE